MTTGGIMISQDRLKRLFIRGDNKMRQALRGLLPSAIIGRLTGPKVLMNSIPKSGTNLLENALSNMPHMRAGLTLMTLTIV